MGALCTLMCAVKATSVDLEAASATDMAATSTATRLKWVNKMYRSGFKFSYHARVYNTKTRRYQRGKKYTRTYSPKFCKTIHEYRSYRTQWSVIKCKMCRRSKGRTLCLRYKKLKYTKRCVTKGCWWCSACSV